MQLIQHHYFLLHYNPPFWWISRNI